MSDEPDAPALPHPAELPDDRARRAAVRASAPSFWTSHEEWVEREMGAARLLLAFEAAGGGAAPPPCGDDIGAAVTPYQGRLGSPGEWGGRMLRLAAAHPNTPLPALVWLARRCAHDLARNPALPLLPLESPGFFRDMGSGPVQTLLRSPGLPASVAEALAAGAADGAEATHGPAAARHCFANDWVLREDARRHVSLAGEVAAGDAWCAGVRAWYREAVRDAYQKEAGEFPLYYGQPGGKWSGAALERMHLRPDFAEVGLAPPEPVEGEGPFPEPAAPPFTPPRPAKPAAIAAVLAEAGDPTTDPQRLFQIADDTRYWEVKYAVARNPSAGKEALTRLSRRDCPPELRLLVLRHPNVRPSLVKYLAVAMDPLVRRAARRHPLADEKVAAASATHVHGLLFGQFEEALTLGPRLARLALLVGRAASDPTNAHWPANLPGVSWLDRIGTALGPCFAPGGALWSRRDELLRTLMEDGNAWVRAAARRRLAEPDWEFGTLW